MFDPNSLFTSLADAATFLGMKKDTLYRGAAGTLCLNEYRREHKGSGSRRIVVLITCQVIAHGRSVLRYGECDGRCKEIAEAALKEARAA